jgi:hypothetical protein
VFDGPASEDDPEGESPGSWREHERVDEQYREPDPEQFDLEPEVPAPPDPTEADVDPGVARRFWALVLVFNAALLALALGAMFVVFEGNVSLGGQLLLAGLAALGFGLYRYRAAKVYLRDRSGAGERERNG